MKQAQKGFRPPCAIFVFSNSFEVLSKVKHFVSGSLDYVICKQVIFSRFLNKWKTNQNSDKQPNLKKQNN